MAFWSDSTFEVKRAFRWQVQIGGANNWKPFYATKVTKPSFTIGETKHNYLSHVFWYPGQLTWNDVTITLVDPIGDDTEDMSKILMGIVGASGYVLPHISSEQGLQTMAKSRAAVGADGTGGALGSVIIQQLKGDMKGSLVSKGVSGGVIDEWTLVNAWIKEVKFGDLDYSSEEMVTIDMTLKYDYAKLKGAV